MSRIPSDAEWVDSRVSSLPPRWERRLKKAWHKTKAKDYVRANVELRETTAALLTVRIPLDASDASICEAAKALASRCADRATLFRNVDTLRGSMERICQAQGVSAPSSRVRNGPAIARMCCPIWWRRKLRKHQGQTVEGAAIRLGYVNRMRDLYISNERLTARTQQIARNAAALEATTAKNEHGQEFTLAELASKGTANKAIRRAELMTRIAGFERYADGCGDTGVFMTITCPSRFHRWVTVNDGKAVIENKNYDSSETPGAGQRHLAKVWARIRSELARKSIHIYGFRIAEPQHDGTPHWHLLLFCAPDSMTAMLQVVSKQALKDSPDEAGAQKHRCDFKLIDRSKGSAAGYIAKYVAKNIDGHHVGNDLNGKPATETAARVDAWAATWSIRQFQQIGGPPVGVWRELRRVKVLPKGSPEHLVQAHNAVNKVAVLEGRANASAAWDQYCHAQGGTACGRKARIKLATRLPDKLGIYGDPASPKTYGVRTFRQELEPSGQVAPMTQLHPWIVESTRHNWEIVSANRRLARPDAVGTERATPLQPWTSVNNCTDDGPAHFAVAEDGARDVKAQLQGPVTPAALCCRSEVFNA